MTPQMLSRDQTIAFLTEGDLIQLERAIIKKTLIAPLDKKNIPTVMFRGKQIPFFIILELIGKL